MADSGWTVEQVKAGSWPVWAVSCPECGTAPGTVFCRTEEAQAVAWAQRHHLTPRTVVGVRWPNSRPSADWVYQAAVDILLAAALPVPGVLGAEAGHAHFTWVMGIYGRADAAGLDGLQRSVRAGFAASPFAFDGADEAAVGTIADSAYSMAEMSADFRKYVAWSL